MLLMANLAFGLILFECGYRINLRWLRNNPWIALTSVVEASATFAAVASLLLWLEQPQSTALLFAALAMATSPATVLRVVNDQRSSGQVTERVVHLSALNCALAVLTFKMLIGVSVFESSGSHLGALYFSVFVLGATIAVALAFGTLIPKIVGLTARTTHDTTLAFTIAVICVVALTHGLKLSPILGALTFGVAARHHRIVSSASQRGFGPLGDLLAVVLFVFIASTLHWRQLLAGAEIGLAIIAVRQAAKMAGIGLFARISGITVRKGLLVGMATAPMSAFVILVMEQTRHIGINLIDRLEPLAAAAFALEIFGSILVQRALIWAGESHHDVEG
jgi:Kef-type K+ transport system membrane component KefB